MAITYQSVIDKAEIILQDDDADQTLRRWPESELLTWAKAAEIEIAKLKVDAYPVVETVALASGSQQALPSRAIQLLDVLCNMVNTGGDPPVWDRGDVVEVVEKKLMNAFNPSWMKDTANAVVTHVIYDSKRSPKIYWVYPQSTGTNYLEIMTGKLPDNSSKVIADNTLLDEEYEFAMMHFIIAMSFSKDLDIPESATRMATHMQIFMESLGRRHAAEEMYHPKKNREAN
jgi:hypothetical protein